MNIIEKSSSEYKKDGMAFCVNTINILGIQIFRSTQTTERSDILRSFEKEKQTIKYKQIKGFDQ